MKKHLIKGVVLMAGIGMLTGCQDDSRLTEIRNQELGAEQQFKSNLASAMEEDLSRRQRFYQGVAGVYEGAIQTQAGIFNIRLRLVPSLPPFEHTRVRMQEEIAQDLNNLYLNAQIIQWSPGSNVGAVGCRVTEVRPDINEGQISIASPDCPNFYQVRLNAESPTGGQVPQDPNGSENIARGVSRALMQGKVKSVRYIYGLIQPTSSSEQYQFQAERVNQ